MITIPHAQTTVPDRGAPTRCMAGWLPAGMLDWPGRLTATLFLGGCDFRCPFCHNGELTARPADPASWEPLVEHIRGKRDWLDGIVVTGGEPTTDPDLRPLLETLAELRMPVKLDTNGNRPHVVEDLLADGLIAYVALDIKATHENYETLTGVAGSAERVARTAAILIGSGVSHEFRTTAYPGAVALGDLGRIAQMVKGGDRYVIQQYRPGNAMDPRASSVLPYHAEALLAAARECEEHLPTTVRGV